LHYLNNQGGTDNKEEVKVKINAADSDVDRSWLNRLRIRYLLIPLFKSTTSNDKTKGDIHDTSIKKIDGDGGIFTFDNRLPSNDR
jgi:hypothetical protein